MPCKEGCPLHRRNGEILLLCWRLRYDGGYSELHGAPDSAEVQLQGPSRNQHCAGRMRFCHSEKRPVRELRCNVAFGGVRPRSSLWGCLQPGGCQVGPPSSRATSAPFRFEVKWGFHHPVSSRLGFALLRSSCKQDWAVQKRNQRAYYPVTLALPHRPCLLPRHTGERGGGGGGGCGRLLEIPSRAGVLGAVPHTTVKSTTNTGRGGQAVFAARSQCPFQNISAAACC